MIYDTNFIWTHIGRTGGYSVDKMFRILDRSSIHLDPINATFSDWKRHQTFEQRATEMGDQWLLGKKRVLSIRRLPYWILSFAEFKKKYQKIPFTHDDIVNAKLKAEGRDVSSGNMESKHHSFQPDDMLRYYGYEKIDIWLRTDFLVADFIRCFGEWYDISNQEVIQLGQVFENSNNYARNINERFTNAEMQNMYDQCPIWTSLEKQLYGNLLV